ncbi:MAG: methyltransferase domain-containing protein [Myxococcota bacterium]|nr:methyltransferase domain-containing protein [Myxococcota bacterium]
MAALHSIEIRPLPSWLPLQKLLGDYPWEIQKLEGGLAATTTLVRKDAALLQARLRGLGLEGSPLEVTVSPKIPRPWVREARRLEAVARRHKTKSFLRSGTLTDEEGRFSLTPESIALEIGSMARGQTILDLGCGVGGNSIGFARSECKVVSIERSKQRLAMARHNARIYRVQANIDFRHADLEFVPDIPAADIAFIDPPWGENYDRISVEYEDLPLLSTVLNMPLQVSEYWLKLPPPFKTKTLPFPVREVRPLFGHQPGDAHRIKFLLVTLVRP